MSRTLSNASQQSLLSRLDDHDDEQLFELLDVGTQNHLQREFVAECLDDDDRESAVFSLIDEHNGKDRYEVRERMERLWKGFLDGRDLLNTYRSQIEQNYLDANEGDEEPEQFDEQFSGGTH